MPALINEFNTIAAEAETIKRTNLLIKFCFVKALNYIITGR